MRSTEQSANPTVRSAHAAVGASSASYTDALRREVARTPFSQATTLSGAATPAALRARSPAAMTGATRGRTPSPTAVVTRSASTSRRTASPLSARTADTPAIRSSAQISSVTWTV